MGVVKEFREFAIKGNMVDMAVGIIIGAAFGGLVKSMVDRLMMPPLGLLMGGMDLSDKKITLRPGMEAPPGGKAVPPNELQYGAFITDLINFIIVAFAVFLLVKALNTARRHFAEEPVVTPVAPTSQEKLLTEIRDLLARERR